MRKKIGILAFFVITVGSNPLFSYDGEVHQILNEKAIDPANSKIDNVLRNQLGVVKGIDSELIKDHVSKTIKEWTAFGGDAEDYGKKGKGDFWSTRAHNHFHDPLEDWNDAGLDNLALRLNYHLHYDRYPVSAIVWGLNPEEQDFEENTTGDWSWGNAKESYYIYLTGKNLEDELLADTEAEKSAYLADCFRSLGQVMHLLQDTSVPLHTRNDVHIFPLGKMKDYKIFWNYETYTLKNKDYLDYTSQPPDQSVFNAYNPEPGYAGISPVSGLFDMNKYVATNPAVTLQSDIGLAEYSNANFLSDDTMFVSEFPYPNTADCIIYIDENNNRRYLSNNQANNVNTEKITHLATVSWLHFWRWRYFPQVHFYLPVDLDDLCYTEYASLLIPRAVGYSAELLNYFFRGTFDIKSPYDLNCINTVRNSDYDIIGLEFKVKNTSPSGNSTENMSNGSIDLSYQYIPPGEEDIIYGLVEDIYIVANESDSINSEYVDITVSFTTPIPSDTQDISFILIYRGVLGNEVDDAIVAQKLPSICESMIAFYSQPGGPGNEINIVIIEPDGTEERQITNNSDGRPYKTGPAWSPDGAMLAFNTDSDIIVLDMTSQLDYPDNIIHELDTGYYEYDPSFSPDGNKIVAIRDDDEQDEEDNDQIIVFNLETGTWYSLGEVGEDGDPMIGGGDAHKPRWSPDGSKIAYSSYPNIENSLDDMHDIFIMDAETGVKVNLTNSDNYTDIAPNWSPDGQYIVFSSDRDGGEYRDLWLYDNNNGQYDQLTDLETNCHSPSFSPDGNKILFSAYHYTMEEPGYYTLHYYGLLHFNIYVNAGYTLLKEAEPLESDPAWSFQFSPPVVDLFYADPAYVEAGGSTALYWETSNALSCNIETNVGEDIGSVDLNGYINVSPSATTTYTITAYGKAGCRVSTSIVVTVTE
jgi:hypothetical protein